MKITCLLPILSLFSLIAKAQSIAGEWNGAMEIQGMQLRIVFHIIENGDVLEATMDSPDQGATGIPVPEVTFEKPVLNIKMPGLMLEYRGTVNEDFTAIDGKLTQHGMTFDLPLRRSAIEKKVLMRPQEPKKPYPYREEEVTYPNPAAALTLAGTLTLPNEEGSFPAVILITGSGPQNRDEELMGHKPFLVIADHLTRKGIAVLRFDDRGIGKSSGDFSKATSEDFASDVLAGIDYLKTRDDIRHGQIGLVGHSEGGLIGPMVAARSNDVAFLVLLAGPGTSGEEVLLTQTQRIGQAEGQAPEVTELNINITKKAFQLLQDEPDIEKLKARLTDFLKGEIGKLSDSSKKKLGDADAFVARQVDQITSPWFRFFLNFQPKQVLEKVHCPVLALNGENDLQVEPKANLKAIGEALEKGGNHQFTLKEMPRLNHLFQESDTGKVSEYAQLEETFSPLALKEISSWILERVK